VVPKAWCVAEADQPEALAAPMLAFTPSDETKPRFVAEVE
jgi:hypothetical protein